MNTGIERRPFKLLRPVEHAGAMVIARYGIRQPAAASAPVEANDLLWKALRVGSLCAACAFAFFVLSERNLFRRAGETLGPVPDSIERARLKTPLETTAKPAEPPHFALPDGKNLNLTEFNLSMTPEFQEVGTVELKLAGINAAAQTYDIAVKTGEREFYRQDVRLNEHIPLSKYLRHGPELVVGAISQNRVYGYLTDPQYRGRRRHRRHN